MNNNYYKIGDHNVQCDICGKKRKRSQCRKTWDNLIACITTCYDAKHPNEYPDYIIPDGLPVQDARPRQEAANWVYLDTTLGLSLWNNLYPVPAVFDESDPLGTPPALIVFDEDGTGNTAYWENINVNWEDM